MVVEDINILVVSLQLVELLHQDERLVIYPQGRQDVAD